MKAVIGGQLDKDRIAAYLRDNQEGLFEEILIKTDIQAAMALKSGAADYYFGACNTGGGGALAMAISIAGLDKCLTVGMPGNRLPEDKIREAVRRGKAAFGFTPQDTEWALEIILDEIRRK